MKTIKENIQQTLSQTHNDMLLKRPSALSGQQKIEGEAFLRIFPSERDVLSFFAPVTWAAAVAHADKCTVFPYMTLQMLDLIYCEGLAVRMVENNLRGIFSLARPQEPIYDFAVRQAAQLFVAKFGTELSAYATLLYFGQYLTDYKSSYGQFDLIDVLRQCGKAFIPKWRTRLGHHLQNAKKAQEGFCEVGKAALYTYLRHEYVDKGINVRTSPVVRLSSLTEKEIRFIESGEPLLL